MCRKVDYEEGGEGGSGVEDVHPHGLDVFAIVFVAEGRSRRGDAGGTVNALDVAVNKSR